MLAGLMAWISQTFPPKSNFKATDLPDLRGKVFIVTGANSGLGKETAKTLLEHDATVYLAGRDVRALELAVDDIHSQTGGKQGKTLRCDLGDLDSVKACAAQFLSQENELHCLINNAGVMNSPLEMLTTQGYDLQFGINVLGHFFLTKLLLPTLIATARNAPERKARVVHVSSIMHHGVSTVDFTTLRSSPTRRRLGSLGLYCQSKLGSILVSKELARRYGEQGIVSVALHPGNSRTRLTRYSSPDDIFPRWIVDLIMWDIEYGVLCSLWAAASPETADLNGKYLIPWARVGKTTKEAEDEVLARELWAWLEEQIERVEREA